MAMGIVSGKDFDSEFKKLNPDSPPESLTKELKEIQIKENEKKAIIIDVNKGRGVGNVEVPNSLRQVIGETGAIDGRREAIELAKSFGISSSSASAYTNGSTSTATYDDKPNGKSIEDAKERISRKARNKLSLALSKITGDKLDVAKVRDLSGIAKDMSAIIKNLEPDIPPLPPGTTGPTFVIYSPQVKKEETFDTIYSKE